MKVTVFNQGIDKDKLYGKNFEEIELQLVYDKPFNVSTNTRLRLTDYVLGVVKVTHDFGNSKIVKAKILTGSPNCYVPFHYTFNQDWELFHLINEVYIGGIDPYTED